LYSQVALIRWRWTSTSGGLARSRRPPERRWAGKKLDTSDETPLFGWRYSASVAVLTVASWLIDIGKAAVGGPFVSASWYGVIAGLATDN